MGNNVMGPQKRETFEEKFLAERAARRAALQDQSPDSKSS